MKISTSVIILSILSLLFLSCSDDQCNTEVDALLKSEFIINDTTLTYIKYLDSLSIYSPEWTDSIHYLKEGSENSLFFTLSPESNTIEIIFTSTQAPLKDTLFIYYQREIIFLSPECGFTTNYIIDTVLNTYNYIDSVEVLNENITTNKNGHIQIYF